MSKDKKFRVKSLAAAMAPISILSIAGIATMAGSLITYIKHDDISCSLGLTSGCVTLVSSEMHYMKESKVTVSFPSNQTFDYLELYMDNELIGSDYYVLDDSKKNITIQACVMTGYKLSVNYFTIERKAIKIEKNIEKSTQKTTFTVGETFSPKGLALDVTYIGETKPSETITNGYTTSIVDNYEFKQDDVGEIDVDVYYLDCKCKKAYTITIEPAKLTSIRFNKEESEKRGLVTEYTVTKSPTFTTEGLCVELVYSDGSVQELDIKTEKNLSLYFNDEVITDGYTFKNTDVGDKKIEIRYLVPETESQYLICSYAIKVYPDPEEIESITINEAWLSDTKNTTFYTGQTYSRNNMIIDVVYKNGTKRTVSNGIVTNFDGIKFEDSEGGKTKTVEVWIPDISEKDKTTYDINIYKKAVNKIELGDDCPSTCFKSKVGNKFNADELRTIVWYNDGSYKIATGKTIEESTDTLTIYPDPDEEWCDENNIITKSGTWTAIVELASDSSIKYTYKITVTE